MATNLLVGKNIRLRAINENDDAITLKWRSAGRAHLLNKGAQTVEAQRQWINSRPSNEFNFIIELNSGDPVGMLSLVNIDSKNRNAESARFLIGEEEKVKGVPVAVEAMLLLYELAFEELKIERIYGTIAEKNVLMIKWQKYLGMKQEGILRNHYRIDDEFQNAVMMGILKEEFVKVARPKMKVLIR